MYQRVSYTLIYHVHVIVGDPGFPGRPGFTGAQGATGIYRTGWFVFMTVVYELNYKTMFIFIFIVHFDNLALAI